MRIFIFLMIPLLASCLVEEGEPEASDAKQAFNPSSGDDWAGDKIVGRILVITSSDNNHSQIVHVIVNLDKDMGLIQALEFNKKDKLVPADKDCADRYKNKVEPKFVAMDTGKWDDWEKNGMRLHTRVYWDRDTGEPFIGGVRYLVLDKKGNQILYTLDEARSKELPNRMEKMNKYDVEDLQTTALEADDCEGSPSGDETHRP